jgi:Alpha galactosidase A/Alpha galactosidase C-terminal beta sandwich domain
MMWTVAARCVSSTAGKFAVLLLLYSSTYIAAYAAKRISSKPPKEIAATPVAIPLPPMGWSSWNSFSNTVDSTVVMEQAKALVTSGLKAKGYDFVNIDEGWWKGQRNQHGDILVDPKQWPALAPKEQPGDMANIVRYIYSIGLRAGIYTDVGKGGCSTWWPDLGARWFGTGSEGHYDQDLRQFAAWGFDFVKVDWCGGFQEKLNPIVQYSQIAHSIAKAEAATGRTLRYSICDWSVDHAWTWAPGIADVAADMWRTSGDIVAPIVAGTPNSERTVDFPKVVSNFKEGLHPEAQHTGYYNDPDMLVIGMPGMSESRDRVHMSLWTISGAPLLIGADVTKLDQAALDALTNPNAIAVDQDALGLQGVALPQSSPGLQVVAKRLQGQGRRAVVFLNNTPSPAVMSVSWTTLGLEPSSGAQVWDVWRQTKSAASRSYTTTVPANDVVMAILEGVEGQQTRYAPSPQPNDKSKSTAFVDVKSQQEIRAVQIDYVNSTARTQVVTVDVNGQAITKMAFPSTARIKGAGRLTVELPLGSSDAGNIVTFRNSEDTDLRLQSITVLAGSL